QTRAAELEAIDSRAERSDRLRATVARSFCSDFDEGCGQQGARLRTGWTPDTGCRPAWRRQRGLLSVSPERPGAVFCIYHLHFAARNVPAGSPECAIGRAAEQA